VNHTPHKVFQQGSRSITETNSPKPPHNNLQNNKQSQKQKKEIIELSASLKHNSFGISYHTAELGFLFSFIRR
jgi:hypothetical protein